MKHSHILPELLVPAADENKLATALLYGADAVYLGGTDLNLRAQAGGFSFPALRQAVTTAHAQNCKVYFTLNLLAWEEQLPKINHYLDELDESGVDAVIIADPGVIALAQKHIPHIPVHLSTQANTSNSAAAIFWRDQGVARVNLARELGTSRIRAIVAKVPHLEMEIFVHGAMCMAISGRCLLSAHVNARSANQGQCTHPCRFDYKPTAIRLEERLRPGQDMWELLEDESYTQIMSAEDLCLIKYVHWFARVGVQSLKIEGRMKTTSYLAQVTDIYRTALDDLAQGKFRPQLYLEELSYCSTRPLTTGFFTPQRQILAQPRPRAQRKNIVAHLIEKIRPGLWSIDVKHRFTNSDPLEILVPGLSRPQLAAGSFGLEKDDGSIVHQAHSGLRLLFHCDHPDLQPGFFLRATLANPG